MDSFTALADPTRRQILEMLGRADHAVGDIAARFAASAPAISQHLKILRAARLVRMRVDGQRRIYSLDPAGFAEVDAWTHQLRQFWAARADIAGAERDKATPPAPRRNEG